MPDSTAKINSPAPTETDATSVAADSAIASVGDDTFLDRLEAARIVEVPEWRREEPYNYGDYAEMPHEALAQLAHDQDVQKRRAWRRIAECEEVADYYEAQFRAVHYASGCADLAERLANAECDLRMAHDFADSQEARADAAEERAAYLSRLNELLASQVGEGNRATCDRDLKIEKLEAALRKAAQLINHLERK